MDETPSESTPPQAKDFPDEGINSLASIGQRAVATIIDLALALLPASMAVAVVLSTGDRDMTDLQVDVTGLQVWASAAFVGTWVVYQVVGVAVWGRTLGSLIMGYRVARLADGGRPDLSQAGLRALLPAAFMALPIPVLNLGWVLVFLAAMYNPLRRGFHDMAGGTVVVRTR